MPRDRIGSSRSEAAVTPFIEHLSERGISSQHHFCLCPLTNNAHVILYASDYTGANGFGPIEGLRRAGYQTVYMTSCDTREYGLRGILKRAGFDRVLDRSVLRRDSKGDISDAVLTSSGLEDFTAMIDRTRPFLLHVHTANTHVPYRLSDPQRFSRFDSRADLGRFLNGLEEADWLLSRFVEGLKGELGGDPPLLIVSADHGQSFGEFGYQTHGSAVVKSQQLVPCILEHPRLKPALVEYSSHLDVLPTALDLLGIEVDFRCFGASILAERSPPAWLLWAGHPSRSRTSHFGLVHRRRKLMVDCVVDRCYHMGWDDELAQELFGDEKSYYSALIARVATQLKVE
jgi:membrane-anchored protein YejM (alkaline phosphatase superfamily)